VDLFEPLRVLASRYPPIPAARALAARFVRPHSPVAAVAPARIVVQCVENPYYFGLYALICQALAARTPVAVDLLVMRSIEAAVGATWSSFLIRSFPLSRIRANQSVRLYSGVADRIAYRSQSLAHPAEDQRDLWRSYRLWRSLRSISELEALSIGGVHVGDLIIDTALRFRPVPRIELDDPFLVYLVWQAHRDVRLARHYFRTVRPRVLLTSYTTYIQHGIPTRVALQEDVQVLSFGNFQQVFKQLTREDSFHAKNTLGYRRDFERLPNREERLEEAERQLSIRLSGGIDTATGYMKASAYRKSTLAAPDVRGAVAVFLHDFYDSPHVYADMVFPDFWQWVCFTIETFSAHGIRFFLKPHPNQILLSGKVLDELRDRYPHVQVIPAEITNRQLVEGGIVGAVTVYGTVAHELAYLGVPTIACARHPHIAFDFCRTARSREEYAALLLSAPTFKADPAMLRTQALQFYYMHNLAASPAERELRTAMLAFWKACTEKPPSEADIVKRLDDIAVSHGFAELIEEIASRVTASAPRSPKNQQAGRAKPAA
jgi:hypothetical protein